MFVTNRLSGNIFHIILLISPLYKHLSGLMIRRQFQDPPEIMSMALNFDSARSMVEGIAFQFFILNSSG